MAWSGNKWSSNTVGRLSAIVSRVCGKKPMRKALKPKQDAVLSSVAREILDAAPEDPKTGEMVDCGCGRHKILVADDSIVWYKKKRWLLRCLCMRVDRRIPTLVKHYDELKSKCDNLERENQYLKEVVDRAQNIDAPRKIEEVFYLADMQYDKWNGNSPFRVGIPGLLVINNNGEMVEIKVSSKNRSHKGIGMHPNKVNSNILTYNLNKKFSQFRARVGLNASAPDTRNCIVTFEVWIDGNTAWTSEPIAMKGLESKVCLDVRSAERLSLVTRVIKGDNWGAHCVWVDPCVIK